jgi:hypothetical protein
MRSSLFLKMMSLKVPQSDGDCNDIERNPDVRAASDIPNQ